MKSAKVIHKIQEVLGQEERPYYYDSTYSETSVLFMIPTGLNQIKISVWDNGDPEDEIHFKTVKISIKTIGNRKEKNNLDRLLDMQVNQDPDLGLLESFLIKVLNRYKSQLLTGVPPF